MKTAVPSKKGAMSVFSGATIDVAVPCLSKICIEDIAHSLSLQCRFNGHTRRFYSVAQHSVLLMGRVPYGMHRWALMHDAAEAYVMDIPRPLKVYFPGYIQLELAWREAISKKFGLGWIGEHGYPDEVAKQDDRLCKAEWCQLMQFPRFPPTVLDLNDHIAEYAIDFSQIKFWEPAEAEANFLSLAKSVLEAGVGNG